MPRHPTLSCNAYSCSHTPQDVRADRLVLDEADREAVLSLSKEFLYLAAHLRVEVNFAPTLGVSGV